MNKAQRSVFTTVWSGLWRGFCMGTADVMPGISGATIAFITGIYERITLGIRTIVQVGRRKTPFSQLKTLPWVLYISLGVGILAAVFTLAHILEAQLHTRPGAIAALFSGLIFASVIELLRNTPAPKTLLKQCIGWFLLGACVTILITAFPPITTNILGYGLIAVGFLAGCAMILPGISGSSVLLIFGTYTALIKALTDPIANLGTLMLLALGGVLGVLTIGSVAENLLERYHHRMYAFLIGLAAGGLAAVMPAMVHATPTEQGLFFGVGLIVGVLLAKAGKK